jgi:hypothetical protein
MSKITEEIEKLTQKLSEQYSQNMINLEEYERILEYINKIETKKEINIISKIIQENNNESNELSILKNNEIIMPKINEKHLSIFSWKTINLGKIYENAGVFTSLFGTNRIILNALPRGKTIIKINSIFGLTELFVPYKVKIINKVVPIFSGIFAPNEINKENEELPELYIIGKAVFGNITIIRTGGLIEETEETKREKEFVEKYIEKTTQDIYDKILKK